MQCALDTASEFLSHIQWPSFLVATFPSSQSLPPHTSMQCLVHKCAVQFSGPLLILFYLLSPVHRLSVTAQGPVTRTPPFLQKSPFFGCEAQFN